MCNDILKIKVSNWLIIPRKRSLFAVLTFTVKVKAGVSGSSRCHGAINAVGARSLLSSSSTRRRTGRSLAVTYDDAVGALTLRVLTLQRTSGSVWVQSDYHGATGCWFLGFSSVRRSVELCRFWGTCTLLEYFQFTQSFLPLHYILEAFNSNNYIYFDSWCCSKTSSPQVLLLILIFGISTSIIILQEETVQYVAALILCPSPAHITNYNAVINIILLSAILLLLLVILLYFYLSRVLNAGPLLTSE